MEMSVKTNALVLELCFISLLITLNVCSDRNKVVDNFVDECKCNPKHCYRWVTRRTCALMNGKLIGDDSCNCCPICHIRRDLFESCHQSIPGFKISCVEPLICSKKYGFVCIDPQQKIFKQLTKAVVIRKNPFEEKLISLVPEHQRPLKRVPRMHNNHRATRNDKYPG